MSSDTAYCTNAEALAFCDARIVGDLVSDTGATVTPSGLATDPVWSAALMAASGMVEAACLAGGRYTVADLQSLDGASSWHLRRLVAQLAYVDLLERRRPESPLPELAKRCYEMLDQLRRGEHVFAIPNVLSSGGRTVPVIRDGEKRSVTPVSVSASRLFGHRR